jgi:chromosome partitioning protein
VGSALADQALPSLRSEVRQRIVFADSVARGQLARELDVDSMAAREIAALATEVLEMAR